MPTKTTETRSDRKRGDGVPSTRLSSSWTFVAVALVALVIVVVFILENLHATDATFFGLHWRIPLGVDLLLAALLGGVLVFVVGAGRVLQLRLLSRRTRHPRTDHHTAHADSAGRGADAGPEHVERED